MPNKSSDENASLISWQSRLLPVIIWMVVGLTVFFLIASFLQLMLLEWQIQRAPVFDPHAAIADIDQSAGKNPGSARHSELKTRLFLESHVLERRYHQGMILLMERTWIRYLGFVTGVILCMTGAIFILGKLREEESRIDAKSPPIEVSLRSTSPGMIMVLSGSLLIITTIVTHHEIAIKDSGVYFARNFDQNDMPPLDDLGGEN